MQKRSQAQDHLIQENLFPFIMRTAKPIQMMPMELISRLHSLSSTKGDYHDF